jgi:hypothetical protein
MYNACVLFSYFEKSRMDKLHNSFLSSQIDISAWPCSELILKQSLLEIFYSAPYTGDHPTAAYIPV